MARVSQKALRSRQYVLNRLSTEKIAALSPHVQALLEQERAESNAAREAQAQRERMEAARHAENIMAGVQRPDPESETIRALEKELEELKEKKRALYAMLKHNLENEDEFKDIRKRKVLCRRIGVKETSS